MGEVSGVPSEGEAAAAPVAARRASLLMPVDPFVVLDLVTRTLLPGLGEASARLTGVRGLVRPRNASRLCTREEAAVRAGMAPDDVSRLWRALGFAEAADEARCYSSEDIQLMSEVARLAGDGVVDLDLLIGMVRPMGQLVSRLGAAQVGALAGMPSGGPGGRERQPGLDGALDEGGDGGGHRLVPLLERLVIHAWRRHVLAAASAAIPLGRPASGTEAKAVGFVDIAGWTTLSRRTDWAGLTALLDRFEACVFDRVAAGGGRVVKTLGDEVLFVAPDAGQGAEIALGVVDDVRADPHLPPVHGGLAWGPLLERAGDVFGPTVNVASRVAGLARSGSVLAEVGFGDRIRSDQRFRLERRPHRPVRGYPALATFRLTRSQRGTVPGHGPGSGEVPAPED